MHSSKCNSPQFLYSYCTNQSHLRSFASSMRGFCCWLAMRRIIRQTWSDQTTLKIGDGTFLRGKPECRSQQKLEMCHHYRHSFIHSPHKGINAGSIIHPRELSSVSQSVTQRHLPIFAPICNLFKCIIQSIECFCRQIAVQQHNTPTTTAMAVAQPKSNDCWDNNNSNNIIYVILPHRMDGMNCMLLIFLCKFSRGWQIFETTTTRKRSKV